MLKRLFVVLLLLVGYAHAEPSGYAGAMYNFIELDADFAELEVGAVQGRLGAQLNPQIAVEGRVGFGVSSDLWEAVGPGGQAGIRIEPETVLGAYIKLGLDETLPVNPYLLFGHSTVTYEVTTNVDTGSSISRTTEDETASDPSYGLGVSAQLDEKNGVNVEWLTLDDDDDVDTTTISIGYVRKF